MTASQIIKGILDDADCSSPTKLPVIYHGQRGTRLIGYSTTTAGVDALMTTNHLSATYVSTACLDGDARRFYVAHG